MHTVLSTQIAGYHGYILQEYNTPQIRESVERLFSSEFRSQPALSEYPDREVYRLHLPSGDFQNHQRIQDLYVKRYHITTLKQQLQTLCHTHKAQKSLRIARILLKKGLLTPRPVAYLSRRTTFLSGERILLTEGINGLSLREYVRKYRDEAPVALPERMRISEKRELIRSVAEFLATLHLGGVYHGDLTAGNIFIERRQDSSENLSNIQHVRFRVYLIDLDSVRSTFWITSRRRIKNLDELGRNFLNMRVFSTFDRARFLKHYLTTYLKETRTFRQLFSEVFHRTQFRLQKHHQQFKLS